MALGMGAMLTVGAYAHPMAEIEPGSKEVNTRPENYIPDRDYEYVERRIVREDYRDDEGKVHWKDRDFAMDRVVFERRMDLLDIYDVNNDGLLSASEKQLMHRDEVALFTPSGKEVIHETSLLKLYDSDNNGRLDASEKKLMHRDEIALFTWDETVTTEKTESSFKRGGKTEKVKKEHKEYKTKTHKY
jgi:hypothetical protein